jgi:2Fe-2S ferredoxin
MARVRVLPSDVVITVGAGESILDAALREGWAWPTNCFGQARCTACRVTIVAGGDQLDAPEPEEVGVLDRLDRLDRQPDAPLRRRLACRARPRGDLTVELARPLAQEGSS